MTQPATLAQDIDDMLAGWVPDDADVERYMRWLTAAQYSNEELAAGDVLRDIIKESGA